MMLQAKSRHRDLRTLSSIRGPVSKQSRGSPLTTTTALAANQRSGTLPV